MKTATFPSHQSDINSTLNPKTRAENVHEMPDSVAQKNILSIQASIRENIELPISDFSILSIMCKELQQVRQIGTEAYENDFEELFQNLQTEDGRIIANAIRNPSGVSQAVADILETLKKQ